MRDKKKNNEIEKEKENPIEIKINKGTQIKNS